MHAINPTKSKWKHPFFVIFIILLITIATGFFITNMVQTFYYERMERESKRLAGRYAQNLESAINASAVINDLLEEKLLAAGKVVAYHEGQIDNASLGILADALEVDNIYVYDASGTIIYSNNGHYIGWQPDKNHPVYKFMQSPKTSEVESIRPDTISGTYYKYAYFRSPNGGFVQIGVLAEKVHGLLNNFEIEHLLGELKQEGDIIHICYIDADTNVLPKCKFSPRAEELLTPKAKADIEANREYSTRTTGKDGVPIHQIMLPISVNNQKTGTLVIGYNIESTQEIIRNINTVGIVALLFIFLLLLFNICTTYSNNKKLAHFVYYDLLTGLPNKKYFAEYVANHAKNQKKKRRAVLLMNCRNFRLINLTYGYKTGDELLKEIAANLSKLCNTNCHLFHLGEDHFIFYVHKYEKRAELTALCNAITACMQEALSVKPISIALGIAEENDAEATAESLLKKAYLAAEHVSPQEAFGYRFFSNYMEAKRKREEYIHAEIEDTLSNEESNSLFLEYQPILHLESNRIFGFEALARLHCANLGTVAPSDFITIAETSPLIAPLGQKIIRMVCAFIKRLEDQGYKHIKVSVNISIIQLLRDDFIPHLLQAVKEAGINPANLGIEIT